MVKDERMVRDVYHKKPHEVEGDDCSNWYITGVGVWAVRNWFSLPVALLKETLKRVGDEGRLQAIREEKRMVNKALCTKGGYISNPKRSMGLNASVKRLREESSACPLRTTRSGRRY